MMLQTKRLLILLTDSGHDIGYIRANPQLVADILFIDCDAPNRVSQDRLDGCNRLLCFVDRKDRRRNTITVSNICNGMDGVDIIIAVHMPDPPAPVLEPDVLRSVRVHEYSTAKTEFRFIQDWCHLLSQPNPDAASSQVGFDQLYRLLDTKVDVKSQPSERLRCQIVEMISEFATIGMDMRGFEAHNNEKYIKRLALAYENTDFDNLIRSAKAKLMRTGDLNTETVDSIVREQKANIEIQDQFMLIRSLMQATTQGDNIELFRDARKEAMEFLAYLKSGQNTARPKLSRYHIWYDTLHHALYGLHTQLRRIEGASTVSGV